MRDQDLPNREPTTPLESAQGEPAFAEDMDRPESRGRRQFLKRAAVAGAPVILTVASRPAWGHPCAPSGMCSGNASYANPNPETECLVGYGPDEYDSGLAPWPGSVPDGSYFDEVFGVGPHSKFKQIIGQPQNYSEFERASVAALLNAASGLMPYLGSDLEAVATIICMVHDVVANGSFVAAPNCSWDMQQVLDYFILTFYGP
ncbi:MAG: twin-arginine translocation signal domain-containing protein [Nitrospirota bacterium]|jgi:hypothetical protein